jgi:hypothetical protein
VIFISHRGNITGPLPTEENSPDYILKALSLGFEVEIDVWRSQNSWFLGHDNAEYKIDKDFLLRPKLWCHAKNLSALSGLLELGVNCFWHQQDDYTITSKGFIWAYPGRPLSHNSICVMPEKYAKQFQDLSDCSGVCSDFIKDYRSQNG